MASPSRMLVPMIIGPVGGNNSGIEIVEQDFVIPRLVERIRELEEKLYAGGDENSGYGVVDRMTNAFNYITGEDAIKDRLTHEATAKALTITCRQLNSLRSQLASMEDLVKAAREDAAAARQRAESAGLDRSQLDGAQAAVAEARADAAIWESRCGIAHAEAAAEADACLTARAEAEYLREQLDMVRADTEAWEARCSAAKAAVNEAAVQIEDSFAEIEELREQLADAQAAATEWEARCSTAEAAIADATAEAEAARGARVAATHDLHAVRSQLSEVQRQAEDFQRRFLAERLERRRLHEEVSTLRGNIRVVCRARPSPDPASSKHPPALSFPLEASIRVQQTLNNRSAAEFEFSAVLDPVAAQEQVFEEVWPALRSCLDGHNVCIFAYGQTGSGKTHTMMGPDSDPGLAVRAVQALFGVAQHEANNNGSSSSSSSSSWPNAAASPAVDMSVSMLEVYMDSVHDLLALGKTSGGTASLEVSALGPLSPEQVAAGVDRVPGRVWRAVESPEDALEAFQQGNAARVTAATALNAASSRSHAILTLRIGGGNGAPTSLLHLVDLAGSERVARSEVEGQQLKEAAAINKSLSALGDVISALQARSQHIPYRNSTLTKVLQDSLAGTSKVLLVCCVAPEAESAGETLSTLMFAQRAAQVEMGPCTPVAPAAVGGKTKRSSLGCGGNNGTAAGDTPPQGQAQPPRSVTKVLKARN